MSDSDWIWFPTWGWVHGVHKSVNGLRAEVVRCYENDWAVFLHRDGQVVGAAERPDYFKESYKNMGQAKADAEKWLKGE